jgi:hypothetical protein
MYLTELSLSTGFDFGKLLASLPIKTTILLNVWDHEHLSRSTLQFQGRSLQRSASKNQTTSHAHSYCDPAVMISGDGVTDTKRMRRLRHNCLGSRDAIRALGSARIAECMSRWELWVKCNASTSSGRAVHYLAWSRVFVIL